MSGKASQTAYREGETWKTGSSLTRERQDAYIEWMATPRAEREPSTKIELAELLRVTTQTLRNYGRDPRVQRELQKRQRGAFKVEKAEVVLESLYHQAKNSENPRSVQAAKVLFEWMDKSLDLIEELPLEDLSLDDLKALVDELADELDERV